MYLTGDRRSLIFHTQVAVHEMGDVVKVAN
jgi:hypothetical protein